MRWRGGLGSFLWRDCSLTFCNLSSCFCHFGLHSASVFLLWNLSLRSFRCGLHSVPSFLVVAARVRGCGCCRCRVPRRGFVFFLCAAIREFPVVSSLGFEPNAPAHRERPHRILSDLAISQRGRDAVARLVRLSSSFPVRLSCLGATWKNYRTYFRY